MDLVTTHRRSTITSIVAAIALAGMFRWTWRKAKEYRDTAFKPIPVVKGSLPYFGHLFSFPADEIPALTIVRWQKETGPIMQVNMGVKPWVYVADPQLAHELLNVNGAQTVWRPYHTYWERFQSKGHGITFNRSANIHWKAGHTVTRKYVSAYQLAKKFEPMLVKEADASVHWLLERTAHDGHVDIFRPLQFVTLNASLIITFGMRASSVNDPLFTTMIGLVNTGLYYADPLGDLFAYIPHLAWILELCTGKQRKMAEFSKERDTVYYQLVKDALAGDQDCLAKGMRAANDNVDDEAIMTTCHDVIVGGTDPGATVITWFIVFLCGLPDLQRTLQREIDHFITKHDDQLPAFHDRAELPLLMSAIKECIRLRSVSPLGLPHEATENIEAGGYFIRKGTLITGNLESMHNDPAPYPEPHRFIFDRFMDKPQPSSSLSKSKPSDRDHYAFGWGRRTCPGSYLGEMMIFNVIVRLLAKANIDPPVDNEGMQQYPDPNDRADGGAVVLPKQRCLRIVRRTDVHLLSEI